MSSTVTTKVKGFGYIQNIDPKFQHLDYSKTDLSYFRIFDTADYIIPPNEYNSFFVLSNFVQTDQSPGVCDEVCKRLMKCFFL